MQGADARGWQRFPGVCLLGRLSVGEADAEEEKKKEEEGTGSETQKTLWVTTQKSQ